MPTESHVNIALIPEPNHPDHLVPARWVLNTLAGMTKAPVRLVASNNQSGTFDLGDKEFTYAAQGPVTIDGEEVEDGDRVLFTGQPGPNAVENLIYVCTHKGVAGTDETVLTLAPDADADDDYRAGITVSVSEGTAHGGTTFRLTTQGTITIGSTALEWEPYVPPRGTGKFFDMFTAADGTATAGGGMEWEIEHKLNTLDVLVQLYDRDDSTQIIAETETTDADTVTVRFDVEPAASAGYRVVVIG